jgi:hypothetical protein
MRRGDPSSIRWRLAAAVGPELVALGLVILVAVALLMISRHAPAGDPDRQSPEPTASPAASAWVPARASPLGVVLVI